MSNAKVLEEKQRVVAEVKEKIESSASTILTDYRGLNVAQVTELRKQLREAGVDYQVLKNTLVRRATADSDYSALHEFLSGPTAIAFSPEDVVAAARVLVNFAKDHEQLELKAGVIEGKIIDIDEIKELASLPSKEGLLSMLLSVLQAPMRNFALAVKAVADQNDAGETAESNES